MITSEIKFSQIENRMDADYYRPKYLAVDVAISKLPHTSFQKIIKSINAGSNILQCEESINVEKRKFIRTQNIRQVLIDETDISFVPVGEIEKSFISLKEGDILIVRVGMGVGDSIIITADFEGHTYSDNTIRTTVQNINPFYFTVYLNTKYGQLFFERVSKGAARPLISYENIHEIKVPIPSLSFQSHIETLVKTAYKKRKVAQRKLQEAEEVLEEELGWKGLDLNHDKTFETSFSHLERRFDPEYFKPRYERIKEVLLARGAKPLSEAVKVITKRADFRKTPEKIIKYVAIADIDAESSQIVSHTEMPAYQAPSRATYEIKEGYILTATSGNSTGTKNHASCFVTRREDGFICTNGLVPLQPKEGMEPLYLLFYLKSPFFLEQVRRELTGAAIPAISLEDMKQVLVYLPSTAVQREIATLFEASNRLRIESRVLIEQAKKEVEEMIEGGSLK